MGGLRARPLFISQKSEEIFLSIKIRYFLRDLEALF